jgi:hypothetical protein
MTEYSYSERSTQLQLSKCGVSPHCLTGRGSAFTSNPKASGRSLSNDVFINPSKCFDWNDPHEKKYHSGMGCLWFVSVK